jgi:hypothetical protein
VLLDGLCGCVGRGRVGNQDVKPVSGMQDDVTASDNGSTSRGDGRRDRAGWSLDPVDPAADQAGVGGDGHLEEAVSSSGKDGVGS